MSSTTLGAALREPAHQVSPRAQQYWRTGAAIQLAVLVLALAGSYLFFPDRPWWVHLLGVLAVLLDLVPVLVMVALVFWCCC